VPGVCLVLPAQIGSGGASPQPADHGAADRGSCRGRRPEVQGRQGGGRRSWGALRPRQRAFVGSRVTLLVMAGQVHCKDSSTAVDHAAQRGSDRGRWSFPFPPLPDSRFWASQGQLWCDFVRVSLPLPLHSRAYMQHQTMTQSPNTNPPCAWPNIS
jgi:hypothetical protein